MVCGETLLVNGDLVRMFQQEFPGAKRDLSAIYVSLQRSRPVRKTENYDPERDPIIHIQLCYSMQACQCVLLCTKKNKSCCDFNQHISVGRFWNEKCVFDQSVSRRKAFCYLRPIALKQLDKVTRSTFFTKALDLSMIIKYTSSLQPNFMLHLEE